MISYSERNQASVETDCMLKDGIILRSVTLDGKVECRLDIQPILLWAKTPVQILFNYT